MTNHTRSEDKVKIVREYLKLAQNDLKAAQDDAETAQRVRLHYARLGREYGMSWSELSDAMGLSRSAARMMIQRADQDT